MDLSTDQAYCLQTMFQIATEKRTHAYAWLRAGSSVARHCRRIVVSTPYKPPAWRSGSCRPCRARPGPWRPRRALHRARPGNQGSKDFHAEGNRKHDNVLHDSNQQRLAEIHREHGAQDRRVDQEAHGNRRERAQWSRHTKDHEAGHSADRDCLTLASVLAGRECSDSTETVEVRPLSPAR